MENKNNVYNEFKKEYKKFKHLKKSIEKSIKEIKAKNEQERE